MDLPKNQHYVPRFLLKNFAVGARPRIWAFDKQDFNTFRTNIKNVASETGFNNWEENGEKYSLESFLGNMEADAAPIIDQIINKQNITFLTESDRVSLASFVVVQMLRTNSIRKQLINMNELMEKFIVQSGASVKDVENFESIDNDGVKLASLRMISNAKDFVPHVLEKKWVLLKGKRKKPFYISDNPIALQNMNNFGPRGNIGLNVEGIEIYLPLCSDLTLAMYCPKLVKSILDGYDKVNLFLPVSSEAKVIVESLKGNRFSECNDENIYNLNYLQVRYAERYVFCEAERFELVRDMINDDDSYRFGPRMESN